MPGTCAPCSDNPYQGAPRLNHHMSQYQTGDHAEVQVNRMGYGIVYRKILYVRNSLLPFSSTDSSIVS